MITKQCDKHKINYNATEYKKCPWCYYANQNRNTALIIVAVVVAILAVLWGVS